MKTRKAILFFGSALMFVALTLYGCKKDKTYTIYGPLIENGYVESGSFTPDSWYHPPDQEDFNFGWTDRESFSPSKSLSISTSVSHPSNFVYWAQTISVNIPHGETVRLFVKIKCNLTGEGAAIAIRGDDTVSPSGSGERFATSQDWLQIRGTSDWREWPMALYDIENTIQSITVYLLYLPNTTGEVYFDNIELNVLYK